MNEAAAKTPSLTACRKMLLYFTHSVNSLFTYWRLCRMFTWNYELWVPDNSVSWLCFFIILAYFLHIDKGILGRQKKCRNIHLMWTTFLGWHFSCLPKLWCFSTQKLGMLWFLKSFWLISTGIIDYDTIN